ncbi:uncharacterized protein V6R79_005143 [Siganus canaliculatus]
MGSSWTNYEKRWEKKLLSSFTEERSEACDVMSKREHRSEEAADDGAVKRRPLDSHDHPDTMQLPQLICFHLFLQPQMDLDRCVWCHNNHRLKSVQLKLKELCASQKLLNSYAMRQVSFSVNDPHLQNSAAPLRHRADLFGPISTHVLVAALHLITPSIRGKSAFDVDSPAWFPRQTSAFRWICQSDKAMTRRLIRYDATRLSYTTTVCVSTFQMSECKKDS